MKMRIAVVLMLVPLCSGAADVAPKVAAPASRVAVDKYALLFDRVRAFYTVAICVLPEDLVAKSVTKGGMTCKYVPVTVEKVLKGKAEPGFMEIDTCSNALAEGLEKIAPAVDRRFLMTVGLAGGKVAILMAADNEASIRRFTPAASGVERVATAFRQAKDVTPSGLVRLCTTLLGEKEFSAEAARHVLELLAREIARLPLTGAGGAAANHDVFAAAIAAARQAPDRAGAALVLDAAKARTDLPANLRELAAPPPPPPAAATGPTNAGENPSRR